jgi:hypothetical protein
MTSVGCGHDDDIEETDGTELDELDLYQTDEEIDADVKKAMEILLRNKKDLEL